ncbi:MAG: hypothetical protein ACOCQY_03020 [Halorhabdus sp.]
MERETRLPAIHLRGETMTALDELLRRSSTDPDLTVRMRHGNVTYRYDSIDKIRHDVTLPPVIRSFEVVLTAPEGRIKVASERWENDLTLSLKGNTEWVADRQRELVDFFARHGARLRTFLERYLAVLLTAVVVTTSLLAYYLGMGGLIGMRLPVDALLYGSIAVFVGGILHWLLSAVYPYAVIVSDRAESQFPLYLRS